MKLNFRYSDNENNEVNTTYTFEDDEYNIEDVIDRFKCFLRAVTFSENNIARIQYTDWEWMTFKKPTRQGAYLVTLDNNDTQCQEAYWDGEEFLQYDYGAMRCPINITDSVRFWAEMPYARGKEEDIC